MVLSEMSDIQLQEMTLRWDIEYERSYLYSLLAGNIDIQSHAELTSELEQAEQRVLEAEITHYNFMTENAEHFI
jgi:hypothetical protein